MNEYGQQENFTAPPQAGTHVILSSRTGGEGILEFGGR